MDNTTEYGSTFGLSKATLTTFDQHQREIIESLRTQLAEAQAKLQEAERDAARYRWLRSRDARNDCCDQCGYDGIELRTGKLLDAHIDAAMEQTK